MSDDRLPLDIAIQRFLEYQRARKGRAISTIDTYRSALMIFSDFAENCRIDELSVGLVDRYAETLSLKNFTPKTIRNKLTPIRSFIAFLYAKNLTDIRPQSIDLPSVTEIESNFLDENEQERLLKHCKDLRETALILCLLRSGLRVSELVNAKTDDLHKRSLVVSRGKGGKPRVTFITPDADEAIANYHATIPPQTYLFPSLSGQKLSRQYIARIVTECAKRAGITKKVSPHTLRHTFATNLLTRGARAEDVQPMMGHKNIRTTLIYMHFTHAYQQDRYDEIMQKPAYTPKSY